MPVYYLAIGIRHKAFQAATLPVEEPRENCALHI
jgi:hypothetical protein